MSKVWKRLGPWLPGGEAPDDGDAALRALADVADARRALEQVELTAVRVARRHRRSWTEIATMLTITRQSAWERWRELDGAAEASPGEAGRPVTLRSSVRGRGHTVDVPDVVGMTSADALGILTRLGLHAESATPEIGLLESSDDLRPVVVVRQYPDPGTRVRTATTVRLWLERGDGEAGVREPRRPVTPPRAARAEFEDDIRAAESADPGAVIRRGTARSPDR